MNTEQAPEQLRAAIQILEKAAANRPLLATLTSEEHKRLLKAAGDIFHPDPKQRRQFTRARVRHYKAKKVQRQQQALNQTGIREMRRRPVFTTPNPLPAPAIEPREVENDPDFRDAIEPQHCYICKHHYSTLHHFYDQLCPECAEFNFRKRTELADLRGRVALLTGGRVKIGYQAG
ncbi:MAG: oxidoreductase, partial [Verrucomicrobia bacterium]|nr:oxidoreductase [Verrucomicrobiota bacterium]